MSIPSARLARNASSVWKSHDQAVQWMDKHQPQHAELHRFRAEAEKLLGVARETKSMKEPAPKSTR